MDHCCNWREGLGVGNFMGVGKVSDGCENRIGNFMLLQMDCLEASKRPHEVTLGSDPTSDS